MAKAQDARKEKKKEPVKTTKEKKAEKDEKKVARARKQDYSDPQIQRIVWPASCSISCGIH